MHRLYLIWNMSVCEGCAPHFWTPPEGTRKTFQMILNQETNPQIEISPLDFHKVITKQVRVENSINKTRPVMPLLSEINA